MKSKIKYENLIKKIFCWFMIFIKTKDKKKKERRRKQLRKKR
jgi:hypothetical protein